MGLQITENMFNQFIKVQRGGQYNMFDPRARQLTSLGKDEWIEIMTNYERYHNEYNKKTKKS